MMIYVWNNILNYLKYCLFLWKNTFRFFFNILILLNLRSCDIHTWFGWTDYFQHLFKWSLPKPVCICLWWKVGFACSGVRFEPISFGIGTLNQSYRLLGHPDTVISLDLTWLKSYNWPKCGHNYEQWIWLCSSRNLIEMSKLYSKFLSIWLIKYFFKFLIDWAIDLCEVAKWSRFVLKYFKIKIYQIR